MRVLTVVVLVVLEGSVYNVPKIFMEFIGNSSSHYSVRIESDTTPCRTNGSVYQCIKKSILVSRIVD